MTKEQIMMIFGTYAGWIVAHFTVSHLYVRLCVPMSWYGLAVSPFVAPQPHCQAFRWIIYTGGDTICHMWILFGGYVCSQIMAK